MSITMPDTHVDVVEGHVVDILRSILTIAHKEVLHAQTIHNRSTSTSYTHSGTSTMLYRVLSEYTRPHHNWVQLLP
jgi:hypothetical protein